MINHKVFKAINTLKTFLSFTRTEQRGTFILLMILFAIVMVNAFIPSSSYQKPIDFKRFEAEIEAFQSAWNRAEQEEKKKKYHPSPYRKGSASVPWDTSRSGALKKRTVFMIELNAADTFELQRLRGIGSSYARRIVGYRQRLGGYHSKEQLMEVFGMDSSRYVAMEPNIFVNQDSVKKMDLNTITFKELLKHPYFPFEVIKAIMIYRKKNKRFYSLGELKTIEGINDSIFGRMVRYLRIDP